MAKKQISKNSRAARQAVVDPTVDIPDIPQDEDDSRSRVLKQLADKELRSGKKSPSIPSGMDELTAISRGIHPDQQKQSPGRVTKKGKKSKRDMKKIEKAEMIKDMLSEKIDLAKKRHKSIREYRTEEPADEPKK